MERLDMGASRHGSVASSPGHAAKRHRLSEVRVVGHDATGIGAESTVVAVFLRTQHEQVTKEQRPVLRVSYDAALWLAKAILRELPDGLVAADDELAGIVGEARSATAVGKDPVAPVPPPVGAWVIRDGGRMIGQGYAVSDPIEGWIFTTLKEQAAYFDTLAEAEQVAALHYGDAGVRVERVARPARKGGAK